MMQRIGSERSSLTLNAAFCLLVLASSASASDSASEPVTEPDSASALAPLAQELPGPREIEAPSSLAGEGVGGSGGANGRPLSGSMGDWAEYAQTLKGVPQLDSTFRVLLVKDFYQGASARWFEVWLDKTGHNALRARLDEGGDKVALIKIGQGIFTLADESSAEPLPCGASGPQCQPLSELEKVASQMPGTMRRVPLKVVAGKFQCQHTVKASSAGKIELWHSNEVPVLRLVRASFPEGRGFELVAMGRKAYSAFPLKFEARPFPFGNFGSLSRLLPSLPALPPVAR